MRIITILHPHNNTQRLALIGTTTLTFTTETRLIIPVNVSATTVQEPSTAFGLVSGLKLS